MLISIIIAALIVVYLVNNFYWKRRNLPPGPTPLPLLGNLITLFSSDPVGKVSEWKKQYGPIYTIWFGLTANVCIADYDLMVDSVVKKGDAYSGRPKNWALDQVRGGNHGIACSNGNLWQEQRRFALHVLRDFGVGRSIMEDNILAEAKELVEGIKEKLDKSGKSESVDVTPFINVCIGSIINALLFGYRYDNDKLEEFEKMKGTLDEMFKPKLMIAGFVAGPLTIKLPIINSLWNEVVNVNNKIFELFEDNLNKHRRSFDPNVEPTDFAYAYLNQIHQLKQQGKSVDSYSDRQFSCAAFDLWAAGLETTVTTLRWSILYMMHYPEVQKKVQQELDRVIGHDRDVVMGDKALLPYTTATINEIQRCADVVPLNMQHTTTQDVTLAGYDIPKDTTILPLISCVLSDEKYFPSPNTFKPERFLNSEGSLKKIDQLIPFSLGKRQCMGESLARMELFLVFANIMHNFKISPPVGKPMPTLEPKFGGTRAPQNYSCAILARK